MKKIILLLAISLVGIVAGYAQDANAILDRYMKVTNINSVAPDKENSMMIEMAVKVNQGGTSMVMPVKAISQNPGGKMRMEMEMMGQKVLLVVNGDKGWMQMQGQVQALPKEQIKQMSAQGDYLASMRFDKSKFKLEFIEEKDGKQIVKAIALDPASQAAESMLYFDKNSGLLVKLDAKVQGQDVETVMGEYKDYDGIKMPSQMVVKLKGQEVSAIEVKEFELNFPTTEFMFAEPK